MATAAEEDGAFRTRPSFKASIEEPCQTIAVLQQRSVENGSPGSSDCLAGAAAAATAAAAKTGGDDGEECALSMSDIIAEAMRENGVQQQRRVEIVNEGDWPRKPTSTSAPPALALLSLSPPPPPPPPPSPMPMTSTLKMKTRSSGITVEGTEGQVQREPLAAGLSPPAPASEFPDKTTHSDGADKSSSRVAVVTPETTARNEIGVARAMAEAILDEGYMAPAASKSIGSGPISLAVGVAGSEILVTKTSVDMELRSDGGEASREASSSPHESCSSAIVSNLACSRGVAHQKMSDTKNGAPAGRRGGVDAPFGHAVIIEEHVRAVAETSTANITRKDADRSLELHVGLNGIHTSALANVGRKSGGKTNASGGSTDTGYSSCTTAGQPDEAQGLSKTVQAPSTSAPSAPAVGAAVTVASTTAAEPVAKTAAGDARIGWGAGDAAGAGDGFLSLQGGRQSLTTLVSIAGMVARANMSLPSRVGGAAPGRDALKPPSSGSSAPEEFVLLQEEQEEEETVSHREGDDVVSGTVYGEAGRTFQVPTDLCPVLDGSGLFRLRDSFMEGSSVAGSQAPAADEAGEVVPGASEAEDPTRIFYDVEEGDGLGGGSGDGDGSWAVAPGLDGTGLSEAEGGWGHVDGNDCLDEIHYDDDEEDREKGVNAEASVGASNGMPKASSSTKPLSNGWCGVGENQDPVAPKPEPEAEETDQSELFIVNDEPEPVDGITRNRSLCVKGTPARFPPDAVADTEPDVRDEDGSRYRIQEARTAPAVTADERVDDASDPSAYASVEGIGDEGEFEERQDDVGGVEQAWGEIVEGVVKERAPGSELAEPAESVGADDTTLIGVAFAGEKVGGDENGSTVREPSGDEECLSKDGYQSSREEGQPATTSESEPREVGGGPSGIRSSAQRLVSLVAEVVGARASVPQELLLHFFRAGGGDVIKAAALYRAVADEFVELRDMARKRRKANSSPKEGMSAMPPVGGEGRREGEASGLIPELGKTAKSSDTLSVAGSRDDVVITLSPGKKASEVEEAVMVRGRPLQQAVDEDFPSFEANSKDIEEGRAEYSVTISSQKLGMTVENVLERTVVRAAAPGGGAEAAGVETGSLLVALDGKSTKDSSHFEVIELLRVAKRPLTLRLRRVARERLLSRRAEMRALTRPPGVAAAAPTTSAAAPSGFVGNIAQDLATAASSGNSHSERRHSSPRIPVSSYPSRPPSPPPGRELRRQDSGHLSVPASYDGGAAGTPNAHGGDATAAACQANAFAATPIVSGSRTGAVASDATREQATEVSTGNWEAVEWAESCLLTILRLICVGEEVRALEEEKAAAAAAAEAVAEAAAKAAAAASVSTNGHKETTGENGVSTQQARKEDGGVVLIATFGDRSPVKGSLAEALEDADASSVEGVHGEVGQNEEPGLWQATEAEEAEAAHAHSEYIRREEAHKSIVRLLLEFSGMLERDWSLSRREDPPQGSKSANGAGNPICGAGSGAGGSGGGSAAVGSANRRMENMGALLEQLATLIDWGSEVVAAVEPELRELLCVLLDADLNFDLSSVKFPHLIGGGVAAMLQELLMHLPTEQAMLEAPALAHRLAVSNSVCARGACCALVATTYGLPPLPGQLQLRGILSRLLHDRFQSVRGEAVKALAHVAPVADASTCRWLMLLGERATVDQDLSIRRASVDSLLQIGHRLLGVLDDHGSSRGVSHIENATKREEYAGGLANVRREIHMLRGKLLPTLVRLASDREWQVRVEVACRLDFLCVALGEHSSAVTTNILPTLVVDTDPDVRCEGIRCLPRVARILLGFAMSGSYTLDPSPSVAQNAIKPSATPVSSSSVVDDGGSYKQSSSLEELAVAKEQEEEALGAAEESEREVKRRGDSSQPSMERDVGDGDIQPSTGSVDGREPVRGPVEEPDQELVEESSQKPDRQPDQEPFHKPVEGLAEKSSEGKDQEPGREPIHGKVLKPVKESTEAMITGNQASETVFEALPEALSIPTRGGDTGGRDVDGVETGGSVGPGDSSRTELRGEICAAGEKARRDILGALMPAAAVLIEDPTAEVRGTVAVSLGEMLRLMVGFEDYVSALGAMRSSNGDGAGVRVVKSGEVSTESRGGRGAEGISAGSGSMVTCCCVTGEEEDGVDGGMADREGFAEGLGRRVCHGKLLRDAEEAAAAAADAMAEAAMTAELMDLAGFESVGDDRDDVGGDEDGCAVSGDDSGSEGFPVEMEEGDVDAHVNMLLRSDDTGAIVDGTSAQDFPPLSEGDVSPATEEEETDPPRLKTFGGDESDGSGDSCSNTENKGGVEFKRNGSPQHKSTSTAVAASSTEEAMKKDGSVEGGNGNCGKDDSGSLGDVSVTANGDKKAAGDDDIAGKAEAMDADSMSIVDGTAVVAGGAEAVDVDFNGDPLIGLVRRLLLDADANVACTMLQALRPVWGAELGPGPGPRAKTSRDIAGYAVPAAVAGLGDRDGGEGKGCGGEEDVISPVRRSCMLTPAQVGCVLPALAELYGNPLWRVRAAVAEALPALVSCTLCNRLKDEVIKLSRQMLFDRVDAVRRSAAEQLVMAARIDLDRCPARLLHHIPGACSGETPLPSVLHRPSSPAFSAPSELEPNSKLSPNSVVTDSECKDSVEAAVDSDRAVKGEEMSCSDEGTPRNDMGKYMDKSTVDCTSDRVEAQASGEEWDSSRDRAGACGLWLRLVVVPLMRECLETSYRGKLLALHMTQAAFRLGVTTPAVMSRLVVPALLCGLADSVPNVRLTAARVADDVLSVAAMSSWPPPDGRSGSFNGERDIIDASPWGSRMPSEATGDAVHDGNASDTVASSGGLGSGSESVGHGSQGGGAWWGCGWKKVELKLEALSGRDPDRDVAYFAAQALKPRWKGDVRRP